MSVRERKLGTRSREGCEEHPLPRRLEGGEEEETAVQKPRGSNVLGGCEEWEEVRATRSGGPAWSSDSAGRAGGPFQATFLITAESEKQTLCSVENQS